MKRKNIVFVGDISDMCGNVITLYNEKASPKVIAVQIKDTSWVNCTPCIGLKVRCEYYLERKTNSLVAAHLNEVIIGISASKNKAI